MKFDVNDAIEQAWKQIWEAKKPLRDKPEKYRSSEGFYITRKELIERVRCYAYADLRGLPREECYTDYGVKLKFNLDGRVCDWLMSKERRGEIESHNFGRYHLSGRRYRPKGSPLSAKENEYYERKGVAVA